MTSPRGGSRTVGKRLIGENAAHDQAAARGRPARRGRADAGVRPRHRPSRRPRRSDRASAWIRGDAVRARRVRPSIFQRGLGGGAVIVYGMNVSADGYVVDAEGSIDFTEPSEDVFSYWIGVQRAAVLDVYGRALYETMRYWEAPSAEPSDAERAFSDAWQKTPKIVVSTTLESAEPYARLVRSDATLWHGFGSVAVAGPRLAASSSGAASANDLQADRLSPERRFAQPLAGSSSLIATRNRSTDRTVAPTLSAASRRSGAVVPSLSRICCSLAQSVSTSTSPRSPSLRAR